MLLKANLRKYKSIFLYGTACALLVFFLKWIQYNFLIANYSIEIYVGLIAMIFTGLGIWISAQLAKPRIRTIILEKKIFVENSLNEIDEICLRKLNLSAREYEVLQAMTQGKSNAEIADHLFLTVSTIKTHASNLYTKLDVKSRTQAIEKAKRLKII